MVSNYTNTNVEMVLIGSTAGGRIVVYNTDVFSLGTSYVGGGSYSTGLATNGTNNLAVTVINTIATSYSSTNGALTLSGPTAMGAFTAGKTTFLGRDGNPKIFYGNVCEILMYNTALSTTDRQKVEGYLAWKWSIQSKLPSGHPYYSTNGYITSNTVITTNTKNIVSNPSRLLTNTTLAPFPTNIQLISATTTSLTFSFTAPTTGSTPTSYVPYVNGSAATGSGTPSSYTITGLTGSTDYQIAMAANVTTTITFNPTSITGCQLWFDANDPNGTGTLPANSSTLSTWTDKSGYSRNATANTPITYNTTGLNSKPALTFTNTQYLLGNVSITTPTLTIFAICSLNSLSHASARIVSLSAAGIEDYGSNLYMGLVRNNGSSNFTPYRNGAYFPSNTGAPPNYLTPYLVECWFDGTNEYFTVQIGNSTTILSTGSSGNFGVSSFGIGIDRGNFNDGTLYGFISEIIVFNTSLSLSDRQKVEGYLSWKWGLQTNLPSTHPYYSAGPSSSTTTTIYQNPTPISLRTASAPVTYTYQYTGSNQSVVVPTGTTYMVAELWGAGGGGSGNGSNSAVYNVISGSGGGGGYTSANLIISAGTTLTIIVGQAGNVSAIGGQALATYGGGGGCITLNGDTNWRNTSGGGRSAIQISGADIITAGGGGGGGHIAPSAPNPATGTYMTGGAGGGLIGGTGGFGDSSGTEQNGEGGTQSAGGAAGSNKPGGNPSTNGTAGSQYQGGTGTSSGAGGGGGWYGGGGSNFSVLVTYYLGSGGGGSSYVSSSYLKSGTTATLTQASGSTVAANSSLPGGVQGTIGGGGAGSTTGSAGKNGYAVITFYFT
jgi:hypothetical protein